MSQPKPGYGSSIRVHRQIAAALFATSLATTPAWSKPPPVETQCGNVECEAGTKVLSYAAPDDPYFACPTAELSDYTGVVLGLYSMTVTLTGRPPNISPTTGEPEYEGEAAELIRQHRKAAGVRGFGEAGGGMSERQERPAASRREQPQGWQQRLGEN